LKYTVTSDNFTAPRGTVLTEEQLGGCNISALLEGGHLRDKPEAPAATDKAAPVAVTKENDHL
jgi:hypothetical protein